MSSMFFIDEKQFVYDPSSIQPRADTLNRGSRVYCEVHIFLWLLLLMHTYDFAQVESWDDALYLSSFSQNVYCRNDEPQRK